MPPPPPLVTGGSGAGGPPPRLNVPPPPPTRPALPAINWENFLGVKMFAWIGGLLLFLGVAFFIKYSFEQNLIKPPLRIALGYATGLGLLLLGLRMPRERYAVLVQTLCAAAMLIFYGNTFAAHGMYHLIPQLAAFALMTLVTATAFVLAARLNAQVVAVLGMLGGFLTPILLSTGEDRPLGLFTYIALLDLGLVAIALRQRWHYLVLLGWLGTAVMQAGWTGKFYTPEKIVTAMTIYLGFSALFVGGFVAACRARREEKFTTTAALLAPGAALVFAFALISWPHPDVTSRPALLFGFVALAVAGWLGLARLRETLRPAHFAGAVAALVLLGSWSARAPVLGMLNAAFTLYLLLALLFIGLFALARRKDEDDSYSWLAGLAAGGGALAFALYVLGNVSPEAFPKPWLFFGFVFLADAGLLVMAALRERLRPAHLAAGGAVFLLLAIWTGKVVTTEMLPWALGLYLLFAILHSVYPVVLEKLRPTKHPLWWAHCFPVAALVLLLIPLMKFEQSPLFIWPVVLLVDLLAIVLAAATASLLAVGAVLVLTLAITGCWIFRVPAELTSLPQSLLVIGGFAIFFFLASLWAVRKVLPKLTATGSGGEDGAATGPEWLRQLSGVSPMAHLPAASALLPFLLLIMLTTRLALPDPSPVFGLAALLVVLLLGVVRLYGLGTLCVVGLVATFLLEMVWHERHFVRGLDQEPLALAWHLGFATLFLVFPFLFRERFRERTAPWVASALALPLHFGLIYGTIKGVWLAGMLGLVPAALSVPLFAGLVVILRWLPRRRAQAQHAARALRRRGAVLCHADLPDPVQQAMAHRRVGARRRGVAVAVPSRAASGPADRRRHAARGGVPAAGVQSGGVRLRRAQRHAGLQLVPLHLRPGDGRAVRRRAPAGAAARPRVRLQPPRAARRARHRAGVPAGEHRDRRRLQHRRPHRVPLLRQLRARHELLAGVGGVRRDRARRRCAEEARARALRRPRAAGGDAAQTVPARRLGTRRTLPHRRVDRAGDRAPAGAVHLSQVPRPRWEEGRTADHASHSACTACFMKRSLHILALMALLVAPGPAAEFPAAWQYFQTVRFEQTGLLRFDLPAETIDAAGPNQRDVRLLGDDGREVPFVIERMPANRPVPDPVAKFQATLTADATVILLTTGTTQRLASVTLETPAPDFLKPVTIEGSADGRAWTRLAAGEPVFRQFGASRLQLPLDDRAWPQLRLTLDNRQSPPIPITGARLQPMPPVRFPERPIAVEIVDREEAGQQTRLTLRLGVASATVATLKLRTPEPLFTRSVALVTRRVNEGEIVETTLARSAIYRVTGNDAPPAGDAVFEVNAVVPVREIVLVIDNGDSPPLALTGVAAGGYPVVLTFHTGARRVFHLLSGNSRANPPRYDLALVHGELKPLHVSPQETSARALNPAWRAPEALPGLDLAGAAIRLDPWRQRKPVTLAADGVQQLELDLEVLARAAPYLADLRLVRDGKQLPYLLDRTPLQRHFAPVVTRITDPQRPTTRHLGVATAAPQPPAHAPGVRHHRRALPAPRGTGRGTARRARPRFARAPGRRRMGARARPRDAAPERPVPATARHRPRAPRSGERRQPAARIDRLRLLAHHRAGAVQGRRRTRDLSLLRQPRRARRPLRSATGVRGKIQSDAAYGPDALRRRENSADPTGHRARSADRAAKTRRASAEAND